MIFRRILIQTFKNLNPRNKGRNCNWCKVWPNWEFCQKKPTKYQRTSHQDCSVSSHFVALLQQWQIFLNHPNNHKIDKAKFKTWITIPWARNRWEVHEGKYVGAKEAVWTCYRSSGKFHSWRVMEERTFKAGTSRQGRDYPENKS